MSTHREKIKAVDAFRVGHDEFPSWFTALVDAQTYPSAEVVYTTPPTINYINFNFNSENFSQVNPGDWIVRKPSVDGYEYVIVDNTTFGLEYDTLALSLEGRLDDAAFSGDYGDLDNTPTLHAVATSGDYNDLSNKPATPKRQETYSGTTNGSGAWTVTFGTAFAAPPVVVPTIPNQSSVNQYVRVTSVSATGFTINAYGFQALLGVLQLGSNNITSLAVEATVTEK